MVIQKIFLRGDITEKCNHDCDQAFIKKYLGVCIEYTYISESMLWLHRGEFVNIEWVKIPRSAALKVTKYMRTVK